MSAIQIIELVVFIVIVAGILGYLFQSGKNIEEQEPFIKTPYTKEELENIKLAEELYNKDLRPTIQQSIPKKPKAKPVVDIEAVQPEFVPSGLSSTPVAPEFPNVGKDLTKVFPPDAAINTEAVVEKVKETKSEFPIDKPKKKRKYYPKKSKTSI